MVQLLSMDDIIIKIMPQIKINRFPTLEKKL